MAETSLRLFDSGTLGLGGAFVPVPFFLIGHAHGNVIVDGGNPLAVASDPHAHWGALADRFEVQMTADQHCAAQLERFGIEQRSITHIVQTHLHIDHTGALGHFPDATVVVHRRELEAARAAQSPEATGYVRADYERPGLRWQEVEGECDVFGDGTIRLIETPGHSAGHLSVLLTLPESGPVLLTADAVDNRDQWEGRARPRALYSREDATRSLELLRELVARVDPLVVFGHDSDNWAGLKHAPQRYA